MGFILPHFSVQGGKKEILQNSLIIGTAGFIVVMEEVINKLFIEKRRWNKPFFFHKPDEDDACYQPDKILCIAAVFVFILIIGKFNYVHCPEVPVLQFRIERLCYLFYAEGVSDIFKIREICLA
ncbi:MAG: hypothetical protein BWY69_01476 [Planctomycetes bacterium ADurb.Bin401]|nr:MAG: hypothetical protein BWY69_01476 [Planctomycetes bacterium ADurb.Bin401]